MQNSVFCTSPDKLIQNYHLVALIAATGIKGQTSVSPLWSYLDHTAHFTFPLSQGLLLSAIKGQNIAYLQENSYLRDVSPHLAQPVFPTQSHLQFHSSFFMVPHKWEILVWKQTAGCNPHQGFLGHNQYRPPPLIWCWWKKIPPPL